MPQDKIVVVGARENNLKNVTVEIPRDKLVVITGLSGSGKSSLAFDTIYAEGQRRYVESLSAYARQFLGQMDKPDVDHIDGLSPAVSIDQKSASKNPRSTVGTVTEIYDYLRILFARVGTPYCINGHGPIERQSTDQIVDIARSLPESTKLQILAPVIRGRKGEYKKELQDINKAGYVRVRVDGTMYEVTDDIPMDRYKQHTIEVVVDRLVVKDGLERRLTDSIEAALKMGGGMVNLSIQMPEGAEVPPAVANLVAQQKSSQGEESQAEGWTDVLFSEAYSCAVCGYSLSELEPRMFSFNSPYGACPECTGLGTKTEFDADLVCPDHSKVLRNGAILPFIYKSGEVKDWWPEMLDAVGRAVGFDANKPVNEIPADKLDAVWHGLKDPITVHMKYGRSDRTFKTQWNGVLASLRKRYEETESEWVKNDLQQYMATKPCPVCHGRRLKPESLSVKVADRDMSQVTGLAIEDALKFFQGLTKKLSKRQLTIGERAVKEVLERLRFLSDVGLNYLTLDRNARTLAGGEAQRIRLATQIGSGLMGCLYILDEPSIGLHQRDNSKLIETLLRLRDIGNTVLVVEHDEETMLAADHLMELGPGAGEHGGHVVAQGTVKEFLASGCVTAQYLTGEREIEIPTVRRTERNSDLLKAAPVILTTAKAKKKAAAIEKERAARPPSPTAIKIRGARGNNLKNIDLDIPLGVFCCITGVSGSGKSTLIQDTLFPRLMYDVYGTRTVWEPHDSVTGLDDIDKVIDIDQSPIGRTPRSNPATYTGTFDMIRELFAMTQDAKIRGYKNGRFSFNVKGGRCESCKGDGVLKIEMVFLPDVYVPCEVCKGKRYNRETLEVKYKGKNISEILGMTIDDACEFFKPIPKIYRKLETLQEVGLGYIRMGQPATTLSGGEAQRIKLAAELSKRSTGRTIYILDEPTTGLHFEDVKKLLAVLHRLVDQGNSVIVIEHNLDVIKTADWLIDMGPEGGNGGGQVVAVGTPEDIALVEGSHTGRYLKDIFDRKQHRYKRPETELDLAAEKAGYREKVGASKGD